MFRPYYFFCTLLLLKIICISMTIHLNSFHAIDNLVLKMISSCFPVFWRNWILLENRCVKCVQIQSFSWSVFNPNAGKYGPEKTPYLDTFHAVHSSDMIRKKVNNATEILKKLAVVFDKILSEYLKILLLKITFCNIFLLRFAINSAVLCQA